MDKRKILIVDDDIEILQSMSLIFAKSGLPYEIMKAPNGIVALKILEKELPDLIITDWEMPALDGIELIKQLKNSSRTTDIPVIMATGIMLTSGDLKIALNAGAIDYIRKPIDSVELIARTNSVLQLADYYKLNIEQKNKEVAENTLLLIKNNEFNISITKKLQQIECATKESEVIVKDIINEIDEKVREDSWLRFELSFESVNKDFTKILLLKFPELTTSEIKLCIFIKLGMKSKDIATVLYKTTDSIKVARYRLRQKLGLLPKQDINSFLISLI